MYDAIPLSFAPGEPLYGLVLVFVFIIGACVGSFLNVVIWRLPREESIVTAPSHCPSCGHHIRPWENVPILGWLMLRGRCSKCRTPISPRYPIVELMTAILMLGAWMRGLELGRPLPMVIGWVILMAILVAIIYIDIDHMIIPDSINLFGLIVALVLAVGWPSSHDFQGVPNSLRDLSHRPLLIPVVELITRVWPSMLHSPRLLSILDSLLGVVFGGGILWVLVEVGKLLLGRRKVELHEPVLMILDRERFLVEADPDDPEDEDESETWEDLFMRERDKMVIHGTLIDCQLRDTPDPPALPEQPLQLTVREHSLAFEDQTIPMEQLQRLTIRTDRWVEPREAMGMGDVKMLGMLGAFLGPAGALATLALSSLLGSIGGVASILFTRGKLHTKIPFGPYIALAAMLYTLFGDTIWELYLRFLDTLLPLLP